MILDELVLHNFGVYRGRQVLKLTPPSRTRPIILIGGMNGDGKTTLLDAVQLALFGKLASCSNRGSLSYVEFLRASVHRSVPPSEGAAVELAFRHRLEGHEHSVRIRRSWRATGKGLREDLEVERDGHLDPLLTDQWIESVDQFVPVGISRLVFFDGEKIESLADPETSAEALKSAMHALLGLDVVDRLGADLLVYERRQRAKLSDETDRAAIESCEKTLRMLGEEREQLVIERGEVQNALDRAQRDLREVDIRFRREGGDLFEQRKMLEAKRDALLVQAKQAEEELRDLASGSAPLLVVADLIRTAYERAEHEEVAREGQRLDGVLEERDGTVLETLRHSRLAPDVLETVQAVFAEDRLKRRSVASAEVVLDLFSEARRDLQILSEGQLAETRKTLGAGRKRWRSGQQRMEQAERMLGGVPDEDAVATIVAERNEARNRLQDAQRALGNVEANLERVRKAHDQERTRYERLLAKEASEVLEQEDLQRAIRHAGRVRGTISRFRSELVAQNASRIAGLVLESLRHLLRKERLIGDLEIDPETFILHIRGVDGTLIPPERLSAGERQLLAVSLLWGLARAAGRPLPTIVDTPLGRLDSSHRSHLVERYFPSASHQVLLLSTDEEIDRTYWEKLSRHIGRSYVLAHDDETGASRVEEGYFW